LNISQLLDSPERDWSRAPGASESELAKLRAKAPATLPVELLELLRFSNGGEGPIALPPECFCMDSVDEIVNGLSDEFLIAAFPGFLFFGGNGGLERIAVDLRNKNAPWPIVMIDPVAGIVSAKVIAPDAATFVEAIGLEHE